MVYFYPSTHRLIRVHITAFTTHEAATCKDFLQVQSEGNALTRQQQVQNLHKFDLKVTFLDFRQVQNPHGY